MNAYIFLGVAVVASFVLPQYVWLGIGKLAAITAVVLSLYSAAAAVFGLPAFIMVLPSDGITMILATLINPLLFGVLAYVLDKEIQRMNERHEPIKWFPLI